MYHDISLSLIHVGRGKCTSARLNSVTSVICSFSMASFCESGSALGFLEGRLENECFLFS